MEAKTRVLVAVCVVGGAWTFTSHAHAFTLDLGEETLSSDAAPGDAWGSQTANEVRLDEVELRVRRARIGLLSTTALFVAGTAVYIGGASRSWSGSGPDPVLVAGATLLVSGAVGMIASGIVLGVRNRQLNRLQPRDERVNRARIGLLSSTGVFVASGVLWVAYASSCLVRGNDSGCTALGGTAAALLLGSAAAMIATGAVLAVRRRELRASETASHSSRRRIGWDIAHARVAF